MEDQTDSTIAEHRLGIIKKQRDEIENLKRQLAADQDRVRDQIRLEQQDKRIAHLVGREVHFSRILGVPDAGQYRNDWTGRLEDLLVDREALDEYTKKIETLKGALADADAEGVALADSFRALLQYHGMHKTTAALYVQEIINTAKKRGE